MSLSAVVSSDNIYKILKDLPIFDQNWKLKKERDSIWKLATDKLLYIKRHNLYISVYQNRKGIKTKLLEYQKRNQLSNTDESNTASEYEDRQITSNSESHRLSDINNDNTVEKCTNLIPDDYSMLVSMNYDIKYHGIRKKISLRPFHLFYWSVEQEDIASDLVKYGSSFSLIVVDNLITNIRIKNYVTTKLFHVCLLCNIKGTVIALAQAISDCLKSELIVNFFLEFIKSGIHIPSTINIGYHRALLDGVSWAVTNCSFMSYNCKCYEYLVENKDSYPLLLIHVDISSILQVNAKAVCFKKVTKIVQLFYFKCIIVLSLTTQLEDFNEIVICLLSLIMNPFESDWTHASKISLQKKINNEMVLKLFDNYNRNVSKAKSASDDGEICSDVYNNKSIGNFINELKMKESIACKKTDNCNRVINAYYCPDWYDEILKILLIEFLSWTNIISNTNCSVTSDTIQYLSMFNNNDEQINPLQFFTVSTDKCELYIQQGRSIIQIEKSKKLKKRRIINNKDFNCLSYEENWMGKNDYCKNKLYNSDSTDENNKEETNVHEHQHKRDTEIVNNNSQILFITHKTEVQKNPSIEENINNLVREKNVLLEYVDSGNVLDKPDKKTSLSELIENNNSELLNYNYLPAHNLSENNVHETSNVFNLPEDDSFFDYVLEELNNNEEKLNFNTVNQVHFEKSELETDSSINNKLEFYPKNGNTNTNPDESMKCSFVEQEHFKETVVAHSTPVEAFKCKNFVQNGANKLHENSLINDECTIAILENNSIKKDKTRPSECSKYISMFSHENSLNKHNDRTFLQDKVSKSCNEAIIIQRSALIMHDHDYSLHLDIKDSEIKKVKLKQNPRKRKYLTPAPNMKLIHDQAVGKKKRKETLIKNACGMKPRSIKGEKINVQNTSVFDSIIEVLAFGYNNIKTFQNFCDDSTCTYDCKKNCLLTIIKNYCKTGNLNSLYTSRFHLLYEYATKKENHILILDQVGAFLSKVVKVHFYFRISKYCIGCNEISYEYQTRVNLMISNKIFTSENFEKLLNKQLQFQRICNLCKEEELTSCDFNSCLIIDVQNQNITQSLGELPNVLRLTNNSSKINKFVLVGVICVENQSELLYVAYCRSILGHWDKRRDTSESIKKLSSLPTVSIALMIYVLVD